MSIEPSQPHIRVRIKNVKSGRYLSIEGVDSNWCNDEASLTIGHWLGLDVLVSPQIWHIIEYRPSTYIMVNQYSKKFVGIRDRSVDNSATVSQYYGQCLVNDLDGKFQEWSFPQLPNGNYLIHNENSGKFIGTQNRSTEDAHYCIQYDNQTQEDNYQEWQFEEM